MKKISVTIHKGKVSAITTGYAGQGCQAPMEAIKAALGGQTNKEEATAEAALTEDPVTQDNGLLV